MDYCQAVLSDSLHTSFKVGYNVCCACSNRPGLVPASRFYGFILDFLMKVTTSIHFQKKERHSQVMLMAGDWGQVPQKI